MAAIESMRSFLREAFVLLGKTHVVQHPALDQWIATNVVDAYNLNGIDLAIVKHLIAQILIIPLSLGYRFLPKNSPALKHIFSVVVGIAIIQWIYGEYWVHSLLSSLGTYAICALAPRKYFHIMAFVWVMGYMTACHAYFMAVAYMSNDLDHTGLQMVLTMKLSSFAYNLFDGTVGRSEDIQKEEEKLLSPRALAERRRLAVSALPSLLEFLGYVYCFPCLLTGPAFEYAEYIRVVDYSILTPPAVETAAAGASTPAKQSTADSTAAPVRFEDPFHWKFSLYAFKVFMQGAFFLALFVKFSEVFPPEALFNAEWVAAHPSMLQRMGHIWMSIVGRRGRLYFCFMWAEAACVLGGFGFEGYDPKTGRVLGFKGAQNSDISATETSADLQALTRSWNKRTQGWLERYTYLRTNKSLFATYFVSALWHGLYPGWFLFFLSIPPVTVIERLIKQKISPLIVPQYDGRNWKTAIVVKNSDGGDQPEEQQQKATLLNSNLLVVFLYWAVSWVCTWSIANYIAIVIFAKSWEYSVFIWSSFNHVGHIGLVVLYAVLVLLPTPPQRAKEAVKAGAGAGVGVGVEGKKQR